MFVKTLAVLCYVSTYKPFVGFSRFKTKRDIKLWNTHIFL